MIDLLDEAEALMLFLNEERGLSQDEAAQVAWAAGALIITEGDPKETRDLLKLALGAINKQINRETP